MNLFFVQALDRVPNNATVRNNLAVAQLRIGRYEQARENLQALIDMTPDTVYAYFNMAITYTLERDFPQALEWIRRGAEYCSPITFHQFIADGDFNELHGHPELDNLIHSMFGDLPELPGT